MAIWYSTMSYEATTSPTPSLYTLATIFLAILCSPRLCPAPYRSTTSFWYKTSSEARLGPRPPSHQFESGPPCSGMDTTMLSLLFFISYLNCIYHHWTFFHCTYPKHCSLFFPCFLSSRVEIATRTLLLCRGAHVTVHSGVHT